MFLTAAPLLRPGYSPSPRQTQPSGTGAAPALPAVAAIAAAAAAAAPRTNAERGDGRHCAGCDGDLSPLTTPAQTAMMPATRRMTARRLQEQPEPA